MFKKCALSLCVLPVFLAGLAQAASPDPLQIAGSYKCTGYDSYEGHFEGDLHIQLDQAASHFEQAFGAYRFKLEVGLESAGPATYSGFAAAQGQQLAMYFANDSAKAPADRGVGLATITRGRDAKGAYITTLHKSYYGPDYMRDAKGERGAGRGTETCVKVVAAQ